MMNFLIKKFIKNYDDVKNASVREAYGKFGSIVGIIVNAILGLGKILVGTVFNSIAITADGVNNLSDASSSIITFIGFKLSALPADKNHPFGHARFEYLSGLIVAFAIILLGVELVKTSIGKIINPVEVEFSIIMVIVLLSSILFKIWLSLFNKKIGNKISSSTMIATSVDSRNDVIATSVVLLSILITRFTGVQIDGFMGLLVALFIIYSGIDILRDILNPILGELPDEELIKTIQNKILGYDGVINIHDLVVHNYGPDRHFATVHVEVDAKGDLLESHDLIDNIERDFASELDINLVIHLDPIVTDDKEVNELRDMINKIILSIDESLSMHDFRVVKGNTHTNLIFDVLVPVDYKMKSKDLIDRIDKLVKEVNETYYTVITIDKNYISTTLNKPKLK